MSIINEQTQTIAPSDFQNQAINANCAGIFGCYPYYLQQPTYSVKKLTIEAVEGGYIIAGFFRDKGDLRTVAVSAEGLAEILKGWAAQFQASAA